MILGYTAWGYYVFHGKVDASRGLPLMTHSPTPA
jgi:hypothetical protein